MGPDWSQRWPIADRVHQNGDSPVEYLKKINRAVIEHSDDFFRHRTPNDYHLSGNLLRFSSCVQTRYPENNVVHGQWFPGKNPKKAVLVLPHWNAPHDAHNALARGFQKFGASALRLSLPYHDYRMPAELQRADYAVSSNVGRTIDATRQAVLDIRCAADWLESQGPRRLPSSGRAWGRAMRSWPARTTRGSGSMPLTTARRTSPTWFDGPFHDPCEAGAGRPGGSRDAAGPVAGDQPDRVLR